MSKLDEQIMNQAFGRADAMLAIDAELDLGDDTIFTDIFGIGVWFGMAALLEVLEEHGYIKLKKDGESREG